MLAIGKNMDTKTMASCVELIKSCKQAHVLAAGNTAPLAQYMGFRLGRLGVKCTYNIAPEYFMNHVNLADEVSQFRNPEHLKQLFRALN